MTPRFRRNEKTLKLIIKKYGKNLILVGHSLGGKIAEKLGEKYNMRSITFNCGLSPIELFKKKKKQNLNKDYRTKFDIVSAASLRSGEQETIKKKSGKIFHSIENFLLDAEKDIMNGGSYSLFTNSRKYYIHTHTPQCTHTHKETEKKNVYNSNNKMQTYCMKCKKKTGNKHEHVIKGKRTRLSSECACGCKKSQFIKGSGVSVSTKKVVKRVKKVVNETEDLVKNFISMLNEK